MNQRIGSCSLCGGDVISFVGSWMSISPPPPARCSGCGATSASDVIPMVRPWGPGGATVVTVASVPTATPLVGTFPGKRDWQ